MLVRREHPDDHDAVRTILHDAFLPSTSEGKTPIEVGLVDAQRASAEWIPQLSLVAELGGAVVGQVICTRAWVDDEPALGLGPLAVTPTLHKQGVGSALMYAVLGAADALGEPLVALLGHTTYYPRFGFRRSTEMGIIPPDPKWGAHFQVRPLSAYRPTIRGTFHFSPVFDSL